ncbi:nucleotidyltransferase family protein [Paracoccus sp. Z330]|uniref:Nucleotidyltransferase family protein n=1 Tax=Paracoccus onchidii TaxID=3017813 RepID=A0ABT4ZAR4_9RHOB|nr:nucleotidyltransferase family protein [Paracoccus onchidii]MDB6176374.1 nucleotidyltransferase family protein [Paracoccus onchidii]
MTSVAVLLAAGKSSRFGRTDKLRAEISGTAILTHSANNLAKCGADALIAVISDPALAPLLPAGFQIVTSHGQQSDSLRAGIAAARDLGATRCLIALADMPFVTAELLKRVLAAANPEAPSAASVDKGPMPPACFTSAHFDALGQISGDRGARQLLLSAPRCSLVPASAECLRDIDTVADLIACRAP